MKRFFYRASTLLFLIASLFANPYLVRADEGEGGHQLETEVNGYHITLASQNDWAKGENTIVVTLADDMGMPLKDADVEILIAPRSDEHSEEAHAAGPPHDSMSGMDMGNDQSQESMPGMDMGEPAVESPTHAEEIADAIAMREADKHGMYMAETHLEASGQHEVNVMFHVNGEMLQADFIVEIPGTGPKVIVLWSFVVINLALIASAGYMKKQLVPVKDSK
jgi:hypothetical protein